MIEKIPGVGGAKQYNKFNINSSSKKRGGIVYEKQNLNNSKNISRKNNQQLPPPTNIISSSRKTVATSAATTNSVALNTTNLKKIKNNKNLNKNSNFNRKRNFAEVRQIKRGYRHLLGRCSDIQVGNNTTNTKNHQQKKNQDKKQRRKSSFASSSTLISSWDSIEERINLLEKFINYEYYVKSEEDATDSDFGEDFSDYCLLESDYSETEENMRRGHQHHPRFAGQRKSTVVIEDVLAALNKGDSGGASSVGDEDGISAKYITSESSSNSSSFYMDKSLDEHSFPAATSKSLDFNLNKSFDDKVSTTSPSATSSNNNIDTVVEDAEVEEKELPSKPAKSKSKSTKKKSSSTKSDTKKREKKSKSLPDGSQSLPAPEDDVETEELAKLRCTSERTEVVAERETRRNKNRCSDYPGLAFGGSIFSSDTMMKFNIIRNELHNIMKSQLKRVMQISYT